MYSNRFRYFLFILFIYSLLTSKTHGDYRRHWIIKTKTKINRKRIIK